MGLQSVGRHLNTELSIHLYTDSSAAMGMVARKGMGRVRHFDVGELWIQDAVNQRKITVSKVKGEESPSDILTKNVDRGLIQEHCNRSRALPKEGRADSAPATTS